MDEPTTEPAWAIWDGQIGMSQDERDRAAQIESQWEQLEPCPSPDPEGALHCEREAGHDGPHHALRWYREWS